MKYDVFISYSSRNMETALAICHVLENNNIRCWMAPRNIPAGADYGDVIDRAITECKVFLLLYSEPATTSPWVNGELNLAFTEGRHIVPYRIDQTPLKGAMRVMLNQRHWIDAHPDANDEFKSLVDNILPIFSTRNINTNSKRSSAITNTVIDKSTDKTQGAETIDTNNNVLPPLANKTKTIDKTAILHIRPDIDCIMMKFGEQIAELKANVYNHISLGKGRYTFEFISKINDKDRIYKEYNIESFGIEDSINIELRPIQLKRESLQRKHDKEDLWEKRYNTGRDRVKIKDDLYFCDICFYFSVVATFGLRLYFLDYIKSFGLGLELLFGLSCYLFIWLFLSFLIFITLDKNNRSIIPGLDAVLFGLWKLTSRPVFNLFFLPAKPYLKWIGVLLSILATIFDSVVFLVVSYILCSILKFEISYVLFGAICIIHLAINVRSNLYILGYRNHEKLK